MLKMESPAATEKNSETYGPPRTDSQTFFCAEGYSYLTGMAEMLNGLPESFKEDYSAHILSALAARNDFETLRDTFMNFCESPFTSSKTAGKMHLHRNSLQYRLKKIRMLTGHDPKNIKEAFELWAAFLMTGDKQRASMMREE